MSNLEQSGQERDFDFWEFVSCSKCHLLYTPDSGGPPTVPFWITECGHVVCNNHLRSDRSCAKCGAKDVQVAAVQRELEPPMSNWFTSVPQAFDALAFTARFQVETMASLVRYYKRKSAYQRGLIERMRPLAQQNKDLKATVEELQSENHRLQMYMEASGDIPNANGKRQMLSSHRHATGAHTNSSPRSVVTPVGPNRLTIPPDQQKPTFSGRQQHSDDGPQNEDTNRPGSRRFTERYAYNASPAREERAAFPTNSSYAQSDPVRHAQNRRLIQPPMPEGAHIPTGNVTREPSADYRPPQQPHSSRRYTTMEGDTARMPPPALPRGPSSSAQPSQLLQRGSFVSPSTPRRHGINQPVPQRSTHTMSSSALDRMTQDTAASNSFRSVTPSLQTQRFVPSVPSTPSARHFSASSSNAAGPSSGFVSGLPRGTRDTSFRAPSNAASSGQRLPFVPGQRPL